MIDDKNNKERVEKLRCSISIIPIDGKKMAESGGEQEFKIISMTPIKKKDNKNYFNKIKSKLDECSKTVSISTGILKCDHQKLYIVYIHDLSLKIISTQRNVKVDFPGKGLYTCCAKILTPCGRSLCTGLEKIKLTDNDTNKKKISKLLLSKLFLSFLPARLHETL